MDATNQQSTEKELAENRPTYIYPQGQLRYGQIASLQLPIDDHAIFMQRGIKYTSLFNWDSLPTTEDKALCSTFMSILQRLQRPLFDRRTIISVDLNYYELFVLERFVKIIQIRIGEENEDQKLFQYIAQDLFNIL